MPITLSTPVRRMSQAEFGDVAYEVVRAAFAIRNELGRFFDEKIYKRELAHRLPGVQLEMPIAVTHSTFAKTYFLDVLVDGGAAFEFKAVEALTERHRAQLLNYLLLTELGHGKLVNLRPESIEQEFVNSTLRLADRLQFEVDQSWWDARVDGAVTFQEVLVELLRDWGTCLDLWLYNDGMSYFLSGAAAVLREVEVRLAGHSLGCQKMRIACDGVAFKITALSGHLGLFEKHARRLLECTNLRAILWANIGRKMVTFKTLTK